MTSIDFLALLGGAAIKATFILAIAAIVTMTWRRASAASRHLVWTFAVGASLTVPLISAAIARLGAPQIEIAAWTQPERPAFTLPPAPVRKLAPDSAT